MAFDGELVGGASGNHNAPNLPLSVREKAMLFDLALASAHRTSTHTATLPAQTVHPPTQDHAALIAAFAHAYVLIRDREEGIV